MFQHTAARRRLPKYRKSHVAPPFKFQHTAARRRLPLTPKRNVVRSIVSTHSRPKAAALRNMADRLKNGVSTHSRPKAAA